jgi:hypothetical protein
MSHLLGPWNFISQKLKDRDTNKKLSFICIRIYKLPCLQHIPRSVRDEFFEISSDSSVLKTLFLKKDYMLTNPCFIVCKTRATVWKPLCYSE